MSTIIHHFWPKKCIEESYSFLCQNWACSGWKNILGGKISNKTCIDNIFWDQNSVVAVDASLLFDDCLHDFLFIRTLTQHRIEVDILIIKIIINEVDSLFKADAITQQIVKFLFCLILSRNRQVHSQSWLLHPMQKLGICILNNLILQQSNLYLYLIIVRCLITPYWDTQLSMTLLVFIPA